MKEEAPSILLLDLDGTLVDSAPGLALALGQLLSENGLPIPELKEVIPMIGDGAHKLVQRALQWARAEGHLDLETAAQRFLELYATTLIADTKLYHGVEETLQHLSEQGWRLALCTNKPEKPTRTILENLSLLALFEQVAGGDSYSTRKPDPGHLTECLRAMRASPGQAIMVGDGHNDLLAGRAAGLTTIWARYGYGGETAAALPRDASIASFAELPACLKSLQARRPA